MRLALVACVIGVVGLSAQDNYQFTDPNVQDTFRYARMAVGGGLVPKIKTIELRGRSKVDLNGGLIDCTVNIKVLLPDYYLRVDATKTDEKLAGFARKDILNAIRSGANLSIPPENLTSAILKNERARLARLLLGAATYVTPNVAIIFHAAGMTGGAVDPRESPKTIARAEGRSEPNVLEGAGSNGFHVRVEMDATKMPARLIYPSSPQEETMTFSDRRDVGGLRLPFRITTTAGGRVVDDLRFDEIRINPEIGKGDFKR